MYKIDLHTHSILSPDGSLTAAAYESMINNGSLDYIAVTDHNAVAFALALQKALGPRIIVGEEINTGEGEIIGLYLTAKIAPMLGAQKTVVEIRRQKGLVYIPHPFENVRKGMQPAVLSQIIDSVDIIETHNGRAYFNNKSKQARQWTEAHNVAAAAGSDAHGLRGWGKTYSIVTQKPTAKNLAAQLLKSEHERGFVGPAGAIYPAINKLRRRFKR
jgi:predicted metal-dependent phosphoesterase TrpH